MLQRHALSATLAFCLGAPFAAPAFGGELRPDQIPADTDWVVHFDMEAVTASRLFRDAHLAGLLKIAEEREHVFDLLRDHEIEDETDREIEALLEAHDFDAFVDFKSMTLFGSIDDTDQAVVLLEMSAKAQAILEDLREQPEHLAVEVDGLRFDAWLEEGNEVNGYLFALPADEQGHVVIALCEERALLVNAARVILGKQPSIADRSEGDESRLHAQPGKGSFCYIEVAGAVPGIAGDDPTSRVLSSARAMRFDVGETDGLFLAQFTLQTDKPEEAKRVAQVIQGVVALGSLAAPDGSRRAQLIAELADGIDVQARGDELLADFEIESSRLVELAVEQREAHAGSPLRANEPK